MPQEPVPRCDNAFGKPLLCSKSFFKQRRATQHGGARCATQVARPVEVRWSASELDVLARDHQKVMASARARVGKRDKLRILIYQVQALAQAKHTLSLQAPPFG